MFHFFYIYIFVYAFRTRGEYYEYPPIIKKNQIGNFKIFILGGFNLSGRIVKTTRGKGIRETFTASTERRTCAERTCTVYTFVNRCVPEKERVGTFTPGTGEEKRPARKLPRRIRRLPSSR